MKINYEIGDVFENIFTKDKVIVIGNVPVAVKVHGESPNLHEDDHIDVTEQSRWAFVENRIL